MTVEPLVLQSSPIITVGYVMQVILSLGVVLAIIFAIAKYVLPKFKISTQGKIIEVVDRILLEPQISAYILKVGKKKWLLAASNKNIAKIGEVELE